MKQLDFVDPEPNPLDLTMLDRSAEGQILTAEFNGVHSQLVEDAVVIIPAYNEERFVGSVVLKTRRQAGTVIVVDDGSTDGTADVAAAAGAIVITHERNQGKGVALNTGFRRARELKPSVVITIDADGQHRPEEMSAVMAPVLAGLADIVVGSRYLERVSDVPQHRVWGHKAFNALSTGVSGVAVSDSQSGYRAFSLRAVRALSFSSSSFSVESEMQLLAREHRLRVSEVPITITYHDKPKRPVLSHGLTVLSGILQLTGQYRPLLFFGVPGLLLLIIGLGTGVWVEGMYRDQQTLPLGYLVVSGLITIIAALSLFTGVILHSIRGLILDLVQPQE